MGCVWCHGACTWYIVKQKERGYMQYCQTERVWIYASMPKRNGWIHAPCVTQKDSLFMSHVTKRKSSLQDPHHKHNQCWCIPPLSSYNDINITCPLHQTPISMVKVSYFKHKCIPIRYISNTISWLTTYNRHWNMNK